MTNSYSVMSENPKSREELETELLVCRDAAVPEAAAVEATERESESLSAAIRFPPRPRVLQRTHDIIETISAKIK